MTLPSWASSGYHAASAVLRFSCKAAAKETLGSYVPDMKVHGTRWAVVRHSLQDTFVANAGSCLKRLGIERAAALALLQAVQGFEAGPQRAQGLLPEVNGAQRALGGRARLGGVA